MLLLAFTPKALPGPFELAALVLDEPQLELLPVDEGAFFTGRLLLRACSEEDDDERDAVVDGNTVSFVVAAVAVEAAIAQSLVWSFLIVSDLLLFVELTRSLYGRSGRERGGHFVLRYSLSLKTENPILREHITTSNI